LGADAAAQEQFGPYLVFERLGVGGMATVHRALERGIEGFERVVALKRLLPHLAADASFIKAFVREAKLAAFLNHANIVQLFELGRVGSAYFISMEYIDGRDIRRILRHARRVCGPPPIHVTVGLLLQLCDALDYAHNKLDDSGHPLGLVHRDVSPSNVLVTTNGQVKVIDFGIAKAQSTQLRTQTGRVKGKLAYMAPEALAGKELDARSDLFAAGVIAHELLTARPLFATKNEYQTLMKLQRGDVQPPSTFNQSCPPALDAIVLKTLARDPDDRFASASDLRDALHAMRKQHHLQTTERDIVTWLDWAFSLEMPSGGFTANHELDPASGLIDVQARNRAARPRRTEDDELVDIAWGDGNDHGNGQPVLLDDVPDVSDKLVANASALGADVRLDLDDLADDMPTPVPSYSNRHEVAPAISRTPAPRPARRLTPPFPTRSEAAGSAGVPVSVAAAGDRSQAVSSGVPAAPANVAASAAVVGASVRVMLPPRVRTITSAPRIAASPTPAPPPAVGSTEIPRDGLPTGAAPREPVATRSAAAAVTPAGGAPEPWAPRGLPSASTPPRDRLVNDLVAPGARQRRPETATTESAPAFPSNEFDLQHDPSSTEHTSYDQLDEAAASDTLRGQADEPHREAFVPFHAPTPVPTILAPRAESAATRSVPPAAEQFSDVDADTVYVGPARPTSARGAATLPGRPSGANLAGAPAKSSAPTPSRAHASSVATLPGRPAQPNPTGERSLVANRPARRDSSTGLPGGPYVAGAQRQPAKPPTGTHGLPSERPGPSLDPHRGPGSAPGGHDPGAAPSSVAQGTPSGRRGQRPDDRSGRHAVPTAPAGLGPDPQPGAYEPPHPPHGQLRDQPSSAYHLGGQQGQTGTPRAALYASPNPLQGQLRDPQSGSHLNPQAGAYASPNPLQGQLRDPQSGSHPSPLAGAYASPNPPQGQSHPSPQAGAYASPNPLQGQSHPSPQAGAYASPIPLQGLSHPNPQAGAYASPNPLQGQSHPNPQAGAYASPNPLQGQLRAQPSGPSSLPSGPHGGEIAAQSAYGSPNPLHGSAVKSPTGHYGSNYSSNPQSGAHGSLGAGQGPTAKRHSGAHGIPSAPHDANASRPAGSLGVASQADGPGSPHAPNGPQGVPSVPYGQHVVAHLQSAPVVPPARAAPSARRRTLRIALLAAAAIVVAAAAAAAVATLSAAPAVHSEPSDSTTSLAPPPRGKTPATLKFVLVPADAAITIGGKPVHAGSPWDINLEPGVHQIEIHRDGYKGWLTSIDLAIGETRPIRVALEPLAVPSDDATLTLSSTPPGLQIVIDGAPIAARTPARLALKIGSHTVVLRQNGADVWRTALEARSSAVYDYSPTVAGAAPRPAATAPLASPPVDPARPAEDGALARSGTATPSTAPPAEGSAPSAPGDSPPAPETASATAAVSPRATPPAPAPPRLRAPRTTASSRPAAAAADAAPMPPTPIPASPHPAAAADSAPSASSGTAPGPPGSASAPSAPAPSASPTPTP